jgi:hypothetical protein
VLAVVAVLALTAGENLHSIAAWNLSFQLAPPDRSAEYLSAFHLSSGLKSIVGPALVTGVVLTGGLGGWALLAGLFAIGAWTAVRTGRRVIDTSAQTAVQGG